ncbi:YgiT-type zinc finger protein [Candidatus Pacearchaeota archaeon]|nr:YgiT-type zinc finger protein [Candidatus Pacearchaeota archaeon]
MENKKYIEELKKKIEEKKKVPVIQCKFCGMSHQIHEVELLQTELEVWKQVIKSEEINK